MAKKSWQQYCDCCEKKAKRKDYAIHANNVKKNVDL
jgi:hypothetical protein